MSRRKAGHLPLPKTSSSPCSSPTVYAQPHDQCPARAAGRLIAATSSHSSFPRGRPHMHSLLKPLRQQSVLLWSPGPSSRLSDTVPSLHPQDQRDRLPPLPLSVGRRPPRSAWPARQPLGWRSDSASVMANRCTAQCGDLSLLNATGAAASSLCVRHLAVPAASKRSERGLLFCKWSGLSRNDRLDLSKRIFELSEY